MAIGKGLVRKQKGKEKTGILDALTAIDAGASDDMDTKRLVSAILRIAPVSAHSATRWPMTIWVKSAFLKTAHE